MNNLPQSREAGSAIRRAKGAWQVKRTTLTFDESLRTFCIFIVTNAVAVCSFSKTIIQARERERRRGRGKRGSKAAAAGKCLICVRKYRYAAKCPAASFESDSDCDVDCDGDCSVDCDLPCPVAVAV